MLIASTAVESTKEGGGMPTSNRVRPQSSYKQVGEGVRRARELYVDEDYGGGATI
jgi:hypothetical protein